MTEDEAKRVVNYRNIMALKQHCEESRKLVRGLEEKVDNQNRQILARDKELAQLKKQVQLLLVKTAKLR